jgi:subtilisin family serine protease
MNLTLSPSHVARQLDRLENHGRFAASKAEPIEEGATIAVFDSFEGADDAGVTTHGEKVEQVILDAGFEEEDIQRFDTGGGASIRRLLNAPEGELGEPLDDYIEDRFTGLLDATSDNLEDILDDPDSDIQTINQSQSVSEARVVETLFLEADGEVDEDLSPIERELAEQREMQFRWRLCAELGLPEDASDAELLQALTDRVHSVVQDSEEIEVAQQRFDELSAEADRRGIVHVVTAGNLGDFDLMLDEMGVRVPEGFYQSAFDNGHTTVVGATDGEGNAAVLSSPDAGAEFALDGTDIDMTVDGVEFSPSGTSFSAPAVAALAAKMRAIYPGITDEQIEEILVLSARGEGSEDQLGAGEIQPEIALLLTWQLRMQQAA